MEPNRDKTGAPEQRRGPTERLTETGRWRLTLESRWSRALDELIALTVASQGVSCADDVSARTAMLPIWQVRKRADAAYDELGDLADAIARIDRGTYGQCDECGRPMTDSWLARDPTQRCCPLCVTDAMFSHVMPRPRTAGLQIDVPRQRTG